jgi:hypothetical protein
MKITLFSRQILIRREYSRYYTEKSSNMNFHENPSSGSSIPRGRTDRRTDRWTEKTKLTVAFRYFANVPKDSS